MGDHPHVGLREDLQQPAQHRVVREQERRPESARDQRREQHAEHGPALHQAAADDPEHRDAGPADREVAAAGPPLLHQHEGDRPDQQAARASELCEQPGQAQHEPARRL